MKKRILNSKKQKLYTRKVDLEVGFLTRQEVQVLGERSVSTVLADANFSFKQAADDFENIENPNIVDGREFLRMKNQQLNTDRMFDQVSDPFYDLDEAPPEMNKKEQKRANTAKNIALRMKETMASKAPTSKTYGK